MPRGRDTAARTPVGGETHAPGGPTAPADGVAYAGRRTRPVLTRRHALGETSARSLLLTVLGELVLPRDEAVWTSTLLEVLGRLGVEEKSARQALARSAAEGWLTSERVGRRVRWSLTPPGRRLLTEGAERIYSFEAALHAWDGRWLVLVVSVPEARRDVRHRLRTRLTWAGFGSPAPSMWVTPHVAREEEARLILDELSLDGAAMSFTARFARIGREHTIVETAWDLAEIAARYQEFIDVFTGVCPAPGDPVLLAQVRLVHEWRRFPFLDPQLPPALLPPEWSGARAAALFRDRHAAWHEGAQRRWTELTNTAAP